MNLHQSDFILLRLRRGYYRTLLAFSAFLCVLCASAVKIFFLSFLRLSMQQPA
jgi:hypothetical protein